MLPGQPVGLPGPRRDKHGPGVGVNMLGQHLLGQESEGNHQSPEQEQRAGPQIHQRIGVPLAGEQEGPGSGVSSGLPASAPRGTPAPLPHWPPLSPREHGDEPVTAGPEGSSRTRPSRTAAGSAERWKSGQAPGTSPQTRGGQAPPDQATAPAPGKGALAHSTHCPPWLTDSHTGPGGPRSRSGGWRHRDPWHACPGVELLFTLPVAQCVLTLCAYKHGR